MQGVPCILLQSANALSPPASASAFPTGGRLQIFAGTVFRARELLVRESNSNFRRTSSLTFGKNGSLSSRNWPVKWTCSISCRGASAGSVATSESSRATRMQGFCLQLPDNVPAPFVRRFRVKVLHPSDSHLPPSPWFNRERLRRPGQCAIGLSSALDSATNLTASEISGSSRAAWVRLSSKAKTTWFLTAYRKHGPSRPGRDPRSSLHFLSASASAER